MTVEIQISTHGKNQQLHLLLTVMSIPPNQITANIADVFGLECEAVSLFVDFNGACIPFLNRRGECFSESLYHAWWNSDDPWFIVLIIVIVGLGECWRWVIAYKRWFTELKPQTNECGDNGHTLKFPALRSMIIRHFDTCFSSSKRRFSKVVFVEKMSKNLT